MIRRYWVVHILYGLFVAMVAPTCATAGQVILRWNANAEPDLAGYNVYIGTSSGTYTQRVDVGFTDTPNAPEVTIGDLVAGYTYFFAVTAYDMAGNESSFSNEAEHTVIDSSGRCAGTGSVHVWGRVTNEVDSTGITGITLTLTGASGCTDVTTTRVWGLFWYTKLSHGTYTIIPTKSGCTFRPAAQTLTIGNDTVRIDFHGSCP